VFKKYFEGAQISRSSLIFQKRNVTELPVAFESVIQDNSHWADGRDQHLHWIIHTLDHICAFPTETLLRDISLLDRAYTISSSRRSIL